MISSKPPFKITSFTGIAWFCILYTGSFVLFCGMDEEAMRESEFSEENIGGGFCFVEHRMLLMQVKCVGVSLNAWMM